MRGSGSVRISHETYTTDPGQAEAIYDGMPPFGLAAATAVREVDATLDTARARLDAASRR